MFSWLKRRKAEVVFPKINTLVEVEVSGKEQSESGFCQVLSLEKRRMTLSLPATQNRKLPVNIQDNLLLLWQGREQIFACQVETVEKGASHIAVKRNSEVKAYPREVSPENTFQIEVPVYYRALSTTHLQLGSSRLFTPKNLELLANLPLPVGTDLYLEVRIPDSPMLKFRGKTKELKILAGEEKKYFTLIEFEGLDIEEYSALLKYLDFYNLRKIRREKGKEKK